MTTSKLPTANQWKARPIVAALLRALAAGSPVVVGYVCASLAGASLHPAGRWAWWLAVLGCALGAGWLTFLATARLKLLAVLYELDLAFPGKAPERWEILSQPREAGRARSLPGSPKSINSAAAGVLAMALALPRHDPGASRHPHRIVAYTDLIARRMRIPDTDRERLKWAALGHGLGKLLIDPDLLRKRGALTAVEQQTWETYPARSLRLLGPMLPWLEESATAIESHGENWDGSGFPEHESGEQIPISARILAVAISLDLLTTGAGAMNHERARRLIAAASANDFDPRVVRSFLQIPLRTLRAAAGSLVPFVPERPTAFIVRTGPVLALSAAFLVTTAAGVTGALLPLPDVSAIDTSAIQGLLVSDEVAPTSPGPAIATSVPPASTTLPRLTSAVPEPTTTTERATITTFPTHLTTTTTRGKTATSGTTTTATSSPGTTSTSTPSTTTTIPPSTTTTRPPTTTTTDTTQPPTTTTDTTQPPTTTTDTTQPPTTTTDTTTTTTTEPTTTTTEG